MQKTTSVLAIVLLSVFSLASCGDRETTEIGGKGGSTTLKVSPMHHSEYIDSCTVYIKYNVSDKPSSYDEEVKCVMEDGKPVATFTSLKKGNYYIYGKGWDKEIEKDVVGGIPYTIKDDNKVLNINVPVTEDH